ncbi:MAG: cytidylate kinase [Chloroflexi bacterium RBG_16_48_8]|nr:MAG: cytidylate kinase [Chloroflexi bacterium RBG_16_48_8]
MEEEKPFAKRIAIDGPAGSGKSTIAKRIAEILGYLYFDTGVMYRAVTLAAIDQGVDINNEEEVTSIAQLVNIDIQPARIEDGRAFTVLLDHEDVTWKIRSPEVEAFVSQVSAYSGVRQAMTIRQREIGLRNNVVMAGRDIGTVVLPEADLKVYLDASVEERARRRYQESLSRGEETSYEEVLNSMRTRDYVDSTRDHAPLRAAEDATVIDTTYMDIEEVVRKVFELVIGTVPKS